MTRLLALLLLALRLAGQQLEIHYINVGWGGSVWVKGPNGTTVLLEAGDTGKGTTRVVPYLKHEGLFPIQGLDYTIAGHQHCDHIGGFPEVISAGYDVRIHNYYNGSSYPSGCVDKWNAAAATTTAGALVVAPVGGQIALGNGAKLTFVARNGNIIGGGTVAVSDENDRSIAVLIQYGGFDYLWASDLGGGSIDQACTGRSTSQADVETSVIKAISPGGASPLISTGGVDVLHINHHGSESSTNKNWMNLSRPTVAVIGVGAGQNTGWDFPRKEVVEQVLQGQASACITAPPARVLQTEEGAPVGPETSFAGYAVGNIKITTDGVTTFAVSGDGQVTQGANEVGLAQLPSTFPLDDVSSVPAFSFIGSMSHLAAQENWTTTFTLVNKGTSSAQTLLSFFGDLADPSGNGPLTLPLIFPQQGAPVLNSVLNQNIFANASLIVTAEGPQTSEVLVGSAQLASTGTVDGFAIFHQILTTQEAVVPMETRNASTYVLAFDNTNGLVLGVAVENISPQNAIIPVIIRDDTGAMISAPGTTISLGGSGHTAFVLSDPTLGFPVTADKRGTIEFDTPAGGQISVLGLRFTPPNNALTTIPALANVGTGGGSIAHLASGGDGWQTTFVLVNTGTSSAQATLSFFSDQTGAPLSLPLTFPQGNIVDTTTPSVIQPIAAGATLAIVSSGAPSLLTGSAQLTTTGHVSGFVIFRHNGQEAIVPLESRNANGYIVAFDNTNGTATGVALNAVSTQQVNVPVIVRDATGTQIATDTITLNPNGHYAFTLGTDRYPATLTIRGTIEFDKPANAQIGALGIRIPAGAAHTYTTLPALAK